MLEAVPRGRASGHPGAERQTRGEETGGNWESGKGGDGGVSRSWVALGGALVREPAGAPGDEMQEGKALA